MARFAALISYDGTDYYGWQTQTKLPGPTIQETFEATLAGIVSETPHVFASGRTDSGVHAAAQVVHFELTARPWSVAVLERALNSRLPADIRVLQVFEVDAGFHAQRGADKKQYSYYFLQGPCALPHLHRVTWWIRHRLDDAAMHQALQTLVGEHDFKPFQASSDKPVSSVRTIYEAEVRRLPVPFPEVAAGLSLVRVRLVGSGFLKQMVRGITGTLLEIGEHRRPTDSFETILKTQARDSIGVTAPGRGLWLERVWYPDHLSR